MVIADVDLMQIQVFQIDSHTCVEVDMAVSHNHIAIPFDQMNPVTDFGKK